MKAKRIYKEKFDGWVYNFHCLPNENYFSENILVHNCYKSNTPNGINMSFDTFKTIFDKINKNKLLTQIAFGADSHATSNPDLFKMMDYCRNNGHNLVVPNITVAEISDETADKLTKVCGAVAVSRYENKNACYDSVKKLTDRGMFQCNIHHLVALENYDQLMETLNDRISDPRLSKLNAIVFLSLKQCGRGEGYHVLPQDKFTKAVDFAFKNNIAIGFDSCSCQRFLDAIKGRENYKEMELVSEPCESTVFSAYCSVEGRFYACSFCGNTKEFGEGINILECNDFVKDVWNHERTISFRKKLLSNGRACPVYKIYDKN